MKINWQQRFKNKTFVITFCTMIIAFIYQMLAIFNVVPSISENQVTEIVMIVINILGTLGVVVDGTTEGINDSKRALTYGTNEDVREQEEK